MKHPINVTINFHIQLLRFLFLQLLHILFKQLSLLHFHNVTCNSFNVIEAKT
jgi:hypothetical protein